MAKQIIEAINTPSTYQFDGDVAHLRLYATKPFLTSDGQLIGQGDPILNQSWYLTVPLEVQPTGILYQPSFEIDSTTDGQPRTAQYIAALFTEDGQYVGPWPTTNPDGFVIPPPILMPAPTWGQLAIYNRLPTLLYPPITFPTRDEMYLAIAAAISQQLLRASATDVGNTALTVDPFDPTFPIAVGANDPLWLEIIAGTFPPLASASVIGITKLDVDPDDLTEPIAVGVNSPLLQTLLGQVKIASRTCVLDSNVITGGGTDDTVALQALLDVAQDGTTPLYLIMDGAALTGPLDVYGNTTIYCINSSCGFYLANASDRALLRNADPSTGAITNKNIALIGGTYNGNSANQTGIGQFNTQEADGTPIGLIQMYGVSNLVIHDVRLMHSKTIALHMSNVQNFDINDIYFDNDVGGQFQQGGLQIEGLCRDGTVNNLRGTTQDDFVSLSSDGALWPNPPFTGLGPFVVAGEIQNIIIKGLTGVSGTSACRLFNGIYRIDNIIVDGVTGTWTRVFFNDPDIMALNGNVGTIVLTNVVVSEVTGLITSPIEVTGKMDHFILRNFTINDPIDNRSIINIKNGTNIKTMEIDGVTIRDTDTDVTTMTPMHISGRIQRLTVNNVKWIRNENLAFPASATQAFIKMDDVLSSVQDLIINGVVMNRVPYFIYYQLGFLENVQLSNIHLDDTVGGAGFRTDVSVDSPLTDVSVSNWFGQMAPAFFGLAQPTRLRGDCYARDATPPTFVSASCNGGTDIVSVIFSESMNGINLYLGVTIKKNTVAQTLLAGLVSVESDSIVNYQLDANIAPGDTVTWEYVAADGFTIDWSNNPLANVGAQSVTNANTTRVFDRFTAADGTALNGRTPSPTTAGNDWVTGYGTAGLQTIVANHACLDAPFVAADAVDIQNATSQSLTNDSTFADAIITADVRFTDVNGSVGIVFRFTDTNNFYAYTISSIATILWKVSGGVAASGSLPRYHGPDLFYRLKIVMAGNNITCTMNGAETITTIDAFNNTATKHGIYGSQGPCYIDNFLVVTP